MAAVLSDVAVIPLQFSTIKNAFRQSFDKLAKGNLYVLDVSSDVLWDTYLSAFTDDQIFKTRREHDCSCCRHFIRDMGALVALDGGQILSVWDFKVADARYQRVADAMAALAERYPIRDAFLACQEKIGVDKNRASIDGSIYTFEHFHAVIPKRFVLPKEDIGTRLGKLRTDAELLAKALTQITPEAVAQTLELIASNSIYRGEEFRASVEKLAGLQGLWRSSTVPAALFAWEHFDSPVARIKNTAIGTLLEDLSADVDVEAAVRSFEKKVAPENYKRPTALVTPRMIEDARAKVESLGLLDAMRRRYAALTDVSVNDVLFADRTARAKMKGDAFADLAQATPINPKAFDRVDEIGIDAFLSSVLPTTSELEVYFENKHVGNLVSLVTEAAPNSARLFKWDNPFSWSYNGDVTDSIKERVKARGGNVTGELCCRLAWNNYDDLDFHMREEGYEVYFGTRLVPSPSGGRLDVDENAVGGRTREPVENIYYPTIGLMKDGVYTLFVHQFCQREHKDNTFTVEIDIRGEITNFEGTNPKSNGRVDIATITVRKGEVTLTPMVASTTAGRTEWGITTGQFHRVNAVMLSPNHWSGQSVGNRHFLFILADCINAGNARGFYNEFLRSDLDPHRKVLELIGSRQRTEETPNQLSGLGFSSTKKQHLVVRVKGQVSRVMKIAF